MRTLWPRPSSAPPLKPEIKVQPASCYHHASQYRPSDQGEILTDGGEGRKTRQRVLKMCTRVKHHLMKSKALLLTLTVCFCLLFTAFIQSDTILEVLHFDEGRLLQVRLALFPPSGL